MRQFTDEKTVTIKVVFTLVYVIFATVLSYAVTGFLVERQVQNQKSHLANLAYSIGYRLEANIFRDAYLADSLATLVAIQPNFALKNWQHVAGNLITKAKYVRNLGLAPNDVIEKVYPLEGNRAAIGLDFRTVPEQYVTVQKARQTQSVYIAGPLELVQGGRALIARYPIFSDIPQNQQYWGGLSVVIDYEKLLTESQFYSIEGISVALFNEQGEQPLLLTGNQALLTDYDIRQTVTLPQGEWQLYAKYGDFNQNDYVRNFRYFIVGLGLITFSCGYFISFTLLTHYLNNQHNSLHDELTQLPNRRYLFHELERIKSHGQRKTEFTLLSIDLNDFKQINDTYGHQAGDDALNYVAAKLTHCLRASDFLARVGGDEFIALLNRTSDPEDVKHIINHLRLAVEASPLHWHDARLWLSISVGFCRYQGESEALDIKHTLAQADQSMYRAKAAAKANIDYVI